MKARYFFIAFASLLMQTTALVIAGTQANQPETLLDMKNYLVENLPDVSERLLERAAVKIDADSNGRISDAEFENRMQVLESMISKKPTNPKAADKKNAKPNPAEEDAGDGDDSEADDDTFELVEIPAIVDSDDAPVLLITADELAKAWVPFAKWKTQNGKLTKIVTVGQIKEQFTADSIQEKIRLCVREHIDNHNTLWVILGGDCLPGGKGLVPGGHTTVHRQERRGIPTDIVYISPTNWDDDEDGIYGEFDDDHDAITYPDGSVGIGRIPIRTADDVAAFTEKVIAYESQYPTDQFAANMIYTCTEKPAYPKVRNSWDKYLSKVWDGEVGRFFAHETPWDEEGEPGSHHLSADNFVKLINDATTSKLHIHGHGFAPMWVLEKSKFTEKNVKQLSNNGAYPLITTVSCYTGQYDSRNDPSIVEQMLRAPRAGSVAIVAPVRTGKPHFAKRSDMKLMVTEGKLDGTTMQLTSYWEFGLGESVSTGHAMAKAKQALASDAAKSANYHLCLCEVNLLGDPTLDMRASVPRSPTMEIETNKRGDNKWNVSISTDAPGSTICLWDQKDSYHTATADKNGNATFTVTSAGEYEASVSGNSLNSVSETTTLR